MLFRVAGGHSRSECVISKNCWSFCQRVHASGGPSSPLDAPRSAALPIAMPSTRNFTRRVGDGRPRTARGSTHSLAFRPTLFQKHALGSKTSIASGRPQHSTPKRPRDQPSGARGTEMATAAPGRLPRSAPKRPALRLNTYGDDGNPARRLRRPDVTYASMPKMCRTATQLITAPAPTVIPPPQ